MIRGLSDNLLDSPVPVEVAARNSAVESVAQVVHPVDKGRKRELLSHLIGANNWRQVLVFTRTKHGANRLAKQLESDGLSAAAIHGNKTQGARTRALAGFKDGSVRVLVATDIAARGLDIDQLPHVVNFELPNVPEDYVHRIGRTGRAGNEGEAMSLVCVDEHKLLRDIERLLGRKIHSDTLPGYEPDPSIAAEPIQNGRNKGGRAQGRDQQPRRHRPAAQDARRKPPSRGRSGQSRGQEQQQQAEGNRGRPQRRSRPANETGRGEVDGNRGPAHREADGNHARREPDGNLARPPREANGNHQQREPDGNRARPPREADGNRARPQQEVNGNRPSRPSAGKGNNAHRGRRQGRREKPALLGG